MLTLIVGQSRYRGEKQAVYYAPIFSIIVFSKRSRSILQCIQLQSIVATHYPHMVRHNIGNQTQLLMLKLRGKLLKLGRVTYFRIEAIMIDYIIVMRTA